MIPYGSQEITEADIEAVVRILRSDFLTQGPMVSLFEDAIARQVNAQYAFAVTNATSALHLACLALGLGPGDLLWTSPITFVASANSALYCGANVDFVDIDPRTYNLCPNALEAKLIDAKKRGQLPKVVMPVHLCGQSCDMVSIQRLSKCYGFKIIEDASHAIGGHYHGQPIGNCRYSDVTVFSFHPVKIITTGEGGMILTNDPTTAKSVSLLRNHGITRDTALMERDPDGDWYYEQIKLGFNFRMTDLQAALGLSQLSRLGAYVNRRRELAARYDYLLDKLPIVRPWQNPDGLSAWHLYVIRLLSNTTKKTRREFFSDLRNAGIGVNLHYIPVYHQPYYQNLGFKIDLCPEAERYYQNAITLPLFPTMTEEQQNQVIAAIKMALSV